MLSNNSVRFRKSLVHRNQSCKSPAQTLYTPTSISEVNLKCPKRTHTLYKTLYYLLCKEIPTKKLSLLHTCLRINSMRNFDNSVYILNVWIHAMYMQKISKCVLNSYNQDEMAQPRFSLQKQYQGTHRVGEYTSTSVKSLTQGLNNNPSVIQPTDLNILNISILHFFQMKS